jgi:hypothetical protein
MARASYEKWVLCEVLVYKFRLGNQSWLLYRYAWPLELQNYMILILHIYFVLFYFVSFVLDFLFTPLELVLYPIPIIRLQTQSEFVN